MSSGFLGYELVVHASAEQIFVKPTLTGMGDPRLGDAANSCRAVHAAVAEIDIEIFDLGGPIIGEGPFETAPAVHPDWVWVVVVPLKFVCTLAKAPPAVR